jgi:hypothetical protein
VSIRVLPRTLARSLFKLLFAIAILFPFAIAATADPTPSVPNTKPGSGLYHPFTTRQVTASPQDVEREREKLRQAGRDRATGAAQAQDSRRSKQQPRKTRTPSKGVEQQAPAAPAQAEEAGQEQAAAGASKGSRKRKATSPGADVAAAAATARPCS